MRIFKSICSVAVLSVTVTSTPAGWLEERSSETVTAHKSELEARANPQLRIMVAGASIAFGYASSDGNGFRLGLQEAVVAAGNDVEMVGTVRSGTMKDNANEAQPGIKINDVTARIDAALPKISPLPNIILVQVGANDLAAGTNVDAMVERITKLVDHVFNAIPDVNLILSTLLPSGKTESGVVTYNARLRGVVEAQNQKGRHVYFADVHTGFSSADILPLPDGTHPTDAGYQKMAQVYAGVVVDIAKTRFAPPPPPPPPSSPSPTPTFVSTSSSILEVQSTPTPEPVKSTTSSESTTALPSPSSSSISQSPTETPTEVITSSAALKQLAITAVDSSTTFKSTAPVSRETSSGSVSATLSAASTTTPAATPSASAPPNSGSGPSISQPGLLINVIAMLACALPLVAL
ncbi:uncharacterized protein RCO7_06767 [Rhynchosporium graminicola]|uniref:SGNH hydrolase-type esterase domain-containing protein n=1 Tax=Rhynchosporium graminicola TaxID=2792576 RepID=A0A1E1JY77_9HELO|nr:uncharacterized protein RCO7_06767 [Rhynchosporium commune]